MVGGGDEAGIGSNPTIDHRIKKGCVQSVLGLVLGFSWAMDILGHPVPSLVSPARTPPQTSACTESHTPPTSKKPSE